MFNLYVHTLHKDVIILKIASKHQTICQSFPNSNFLIPISLQLNIIDLRYVKLWILFHKYSKFEISNVYTIRWKNRVLENQSLLQRLYSFIGKWWFELENINFEILCLPSKNFIPQLHKLQKYSSFCKILLIWCRCQSSLKYFCHFNWIKFRFSLNLKWEFLF